MTEKYPYNLILHLSKTRKKPLPKNFSKDIQAGVAHAFATLEEPYREILRQRYDEGKSLEEISACCGDSVEALQKVEKRALRNLCYATRWGYICYGLRGYTGKQASEAYNRGFQKGYDQGYQNGMKDAREGNLPEDSAEEILNLPLEALGLSMRTYNCLAASIRTVRDLTQRNLEDLCCYRNLGPKGMRELLRIMNRLGVKLQPDDPRWIHMNQKFLAEINYENT